MHNEYNRAMTRLGAGVVICLEQGADLHMAQLMTYYVNANKLVHHT